jgi:glyoxylase-like metal-dependent hydrolase (beta-lactamase superfamily II)
MTRLPLRAAAFLLAMGGLWLAYNQNSANQTAPAGPVLKIEKLKDDLFVISMAQGVGGGNVALYVTRDGVILVDDMFDRNHDEIMAKLKSVTDLPIKYVLNTHQHDDHAGGNAKMAPTSQLIGHRRLRANMIALNQPGAPSIVFSDEMDVFLGGKEVRAIYCGRGHTGGDAVIYFPAEKVIHTGDLFLTFPPQPFIDFAQGGSALDWNSTLDKALQLDFDTAIPGHGPVSNREGIRKFQSDFVTMRNRIQGMVRSGSSKDEVAKTLVNEFHWANGGLAVQQVDAFIAEVR